MPITAKAPVGGAVEQLGGESRVLLLRNGEIERFEKHHDIGIFSLLDAVLGNGDAKASQCRDIVALALVGGGLSDLAADTLLDEMPPSENMRIRSIAQKILVAAFVPSTPDKKKDLKAGSSTKSVRRSTTRKAKSKTASQ